MRSRRKHKELPLPRSFKQRREHWLDRYEREVDEQEEELRKRASQPSERPRANDGGHHD